MSENDLVGSRFGHLQVVGFVGEGGMGSVYLAFDEKLQRRVALKAMREAHLDPESKARFLREARVLSQLQHPNICEIYDYLVTPERDFLVLELIEGRTLGEEIASRPDPARRMRLAGQIVDVLVAAHAQGVVHRDLKPANVMVTPRGDVKVLDFGLARTLLDRGPAPELPQEPPSEVTVREDISEGATQSATTVTRQGSLVGTLGYMSPEQARGEQVTTASDIYSLGLVLQELFTGEAPFEKGLSPLERLAKAQAAESLPALGLDPDLTALLGRMKAAEPGVRPTALDTADRLRWIREKPRRRLRKTLLLGALAAAILVAIGMSYQAWRIDREARRANREAAAARHVSEFLVGLFEVSDPGEGRGNSVTARELLDSASRDIEGRLQEEPAIRGALLSTMARVYAELGLLQQGLGLGEKGLAQLRTAQPPDLPAVGRALAALAVIHRRLGQLDKAEPLFREALATMEASLGPDDLDVARTLDALGILLQDQAKYEEAEGIHRKALAVFRRVSGERSRDAATAMTNLANVYNLVGKYGPAEELQRGALEIQEKLLGPDNPEVAFSLNNLATIEFSLEKYDEAERLFGRVLGVLEKTLGPEHADLAVILGNLGSIAQTRGDFAAAEASFRRAAAIQEKATGPGHPTVLLTLSNLSTVYRDTGRYEEAESLQRKVLAEDLKLLGDDHPGAAADRHRLAGLLRETGRLEEAEALQRKAVAVMEKALGEKHPTVGVAVMVLADVCRSAGRPAEAEPLYRRALASAGAGSADVVEVQVRLGALLQETGRGAEAAPILASALDACVKAAAAGDGTPARKVRHSVVLFLLGRGAEARPLAGQVLATGYRRAPFVALCAKNGLEPVPPGR